MDTYSISELAAEFSITPRTIRFYEEKGLLRPDRQGLVRQYSPHDRVRLLLILRGKRLGFSLSESEEIIGLYQAQGENKAQWQQLSSKLYQKKHELLEKRKLMDSMLDDVNSAIEQCEEALSLEAEG